MTTVIKQKQLVEVKTGDGINFDFVLPQTEIYWIIAGDKVVMQVTGIVDYKVFFKISDFTEDFLKSITTT